MNIEKAVQQIIRINKVDGKGWLVYALVSYPFMAATKQPFTFFTKREAIEFCQSHL